MLPWTGYILIFGRMEGTSLAASSKTDYAALPTLKELMSLQKQISVQAYALGYTSSPTARLDGGTEALCGIRTHQSAVTEPAVHAHGT